ncbi:MAG: nitroreductase family protein [Clostridiales bacterium]|nr:nitroreductase family protein [Clostridiales bacterium]
MEFGILNKERRSIRSFKENTKVDRALIEEMIAAAQLAPSWKNTETGRYYVVMSPEKVAEIKEKYLPPFNRKSSANAPVLIVTAFEKQVSGFRIDGTPENELGDGWGCYDLGMQTQNLVLRARELGLDTLIMGIRDAQGLREMLAIPESQEVAAVLAVGYRAVEPDMPVRKALNEISFYF